jgi:hypothetical protein
MSFERIDAERQAFQSMLELYEQAKRCQRLFEQAEMALPEALQRFLGVSEGIAKQSPARLARGSVKIPPPERRNAPSDAGPDWIAIDARRASATPIALALLRQVGSPMRPKDLFTKITEILPNVPSGTIANIGTRLQGDVIDRGDEGWRLLKPEEAGVLHDGFLWGAPSKFGKQELAAHRRDAILHILRHFPTGLQTVQLVEQLKNCSWVHAPVSKDLLKADMEILAGEQKVRRRGNSKKWEITE